MSLLIFFLRTVFDVITFFGGRIPRRKKGVEPYNIIPCCMYCHGFVRHFQRMSQNTINGDFSKEIAGFFDSLQSKKPY